MRHLRIRLLPDGSGRVRIHWLNQNAPGPIQTPEGILPSSMGPVAVEGLTGGVKGQIACMPGLKETTKVVGGVIQKEIYSDDPRAVSCPECQATEEFKKAMEEINSLTTG